ncbi:MAG: VWA domain-containing protein [Lewinellaceae bacterium]|nr:VWA domain-containing protein [Lewinellaceae bacterium]
MSHATGSFISLEGSPINIGPVYGAPNNVNFGHTPPPAGAGPTRFVILHFENAVFPGASRLEVSLGYPTGEIDVFDASSGSTFWTRPVNVSSLPGNNIPISFIPDGAGGGVQVTGYGRGERHEEDIPGGIHDSFSNCDPFFVSGSYTEPDYDPFWLCHLPPHWDNVAALPNGDIRKSVARSVGMLVAVHGSHVSTCSATLIGNDLVISAAHCIDHEDDIASMSVIFNYQTEADGSVSGSYQPVFHKVIELMNHGPLGNSSTTDYMVVRIATPPGGLGISPVPIRNSRPAVGEQVFGIHHPNGAVKKVSPSIADGFAQVASHAAPGNNLTNTNHIPTQFDVSGGTSGSGLFDMAGRFVGVLSAGQGGPFAPGAYQNSTCFIGYAPSDAILDDIAGDTVPSVARDVMLVFDRSGSMSQVMSTGLSKLQEAKNAAALFIQLARTEGGDQIGLVTFSSTAGSAFNLADVNLGNKNTLIGAVPPYSAGIVGGISAGGSTSIGAGLALARNQMNLHGAAGNRRTIFLLTDGLQNTNPMVEVVEGSLINTDIFAVGYGSEAGLNGALLTELAENHNGLYMRAGSGLSLLKFFALTFGNIFEAGTLNDPEYVLPADQNHAEPITFGVCEETSITIILGWESPSTPLNFRIQTPAGTFLPLQGHGIASSAGQTWRFVRASLPFNGEQNGNWKVFVDRVPAGGEFPPPPQDVSYFVNVLAKDGPVIALQNRRRRYYTGEPYNPIVAVATAKGFKAPNASVRVTVKKPTEGTGNILSSAGFENDIEDIDGDIIPARAVALKRLESSLEGQPLITYEQETFELFDDGSQNDGAMEPDGIFGRILPDLFRKEGHYTFRAVAAYGIGCQGTREITWSVHVEPGIDSAQTDIRIEPLETLPGGNLKVRIILTPKDKFGNKVGPGRVEMINLAGVEGTVVISGVVKDRGDGTYEAIATYDPASGQKPGVAINQPGREPATIILPTPYDPGKGLPSWLLWLLLFIILLLLILLIIT